MAKFTDADGREWLITLDVATIRYIRLRSDVNLFTCLDNDMEGLRALVTDIDRLCSVLWLCCESQAATRSLDDAAFGKALRGDALAEGAQAFVDGLLDFFPHAKSRAALRRAIQLGNEMQSLALDVAAAELDKLSDQLAARKSSAKYGVAPA